jgi:DNA polymerase III subunit epsilon
MRQIFFDIETTGLRYGNGDRVVEVAAVEAVDKKRTGRMVHLYFNPEREVPAIAVSIHGLTNEFLNDKPKFKETIGELKQFMDGADEVIIHNGAGFDLPFMNAELVANGLEAMTDWNVGKFTDSVKVARAMKLQKKNDLNSLCERFGIDLSARTSHGAVIDCELLSDMWYAMTKDINFDAPDLSKRQEEIQRLVNKPSLRVLKVSEEDLESHQVYLNTWKEAAPKADIVFAELSRENAAMKRSF